MKDDELAIGLHIVRIISKQLQYTYFLDPLHQHPWKQLNQRRRKALKSNDSIPLGKDNSSVSCVGMFKTILLIANGQVNVSSNQSEQSAQAITAALVEIFASTSGQSAVAPSKRTVLQQPTGKIMTEKIVIDQLQEKEKKKRSRPHDRRQNATNKRQRKEIGTGKNLQSKSFSN